MRDSGQCDVLTNHRVGCGEFAHKIDLVKVIMPTSLFHHLLKLLDQGLIGHLPDGKELISGSVRVWCVILAPPNDFDA